MLGRGGRSGRWSRGMCGEVVMGGCIEGITLAMFHYTKDTWEPDHADHCSLI